MNFFDCFLQEVFRFHKQESSWLPSDNFKNCGVMQSSFQEANEKNGTYVYVCVYN